MIQKFAWLAVAGAMGTLSRYGLAGFVNRLNGVSFPWGTVTVNLTGCFLAGLLWSAFAYRWPVSAETRTIILVGFMGAFTTFSTFIFESGELLRSAEWLRLTLNMVMQNGLGIFALFMGTALGRLV